MAGWRYIAQRATTGAFLDFDVPLRREELSWALSGPGSLRGSLPAAAKAIVAEDGRPLIEEWSTILYAEHGGSIRWGGIVQSASVEDGRLVFEAAGFTSYPHGIPYYGVWKRQGADPFDVVSEIWRHLQVYRNGDLGVAVVGDRTPARLGTPAEPERTEYQSGETWYAKEDFPGTIVSDVSVPLAEPMEKGDTSLTLTVAGGFASLPLPFVVSVGREKIRVTSRSGRKLTGLQRGYDDTEATGHEKKTKAVFKGTPTRKVEAVAAEPYALQWWDVPDCGETIDSLAKETPFDYVEEHEWQGDTIAHRARIAYPRTGTRRSDLAFRDGENVLGKVSVVADGTEFANAALGIGAGTGEGAVRVGSAVEDGRLRRTVVVTDKRVTREAAMNSLVAREITRRRNPFQIDSIDVRDHPNAPIGSWALGDDVLVEVVVPHYGAVSLWCRVVGWSLTSETTASLSLVRSDAFSYGA